MSGRGSWILVVVLIYVDLYLGDEIVVEFIRVVICLIKVLGIGIGEKIRVTEKYI